MSTVKFMAKSVPMRNSPIGKRLKSLTIMWERILASNACHTKPERRSRHCGPIQYASSFRGIPSASFFNFALSVVLSPNKASMS